MNLQAIEPTEINQVKAFCIAALPQLGMCRYKKTLNDSSAYPAHYKIIVSMIHLK